MTPREPTEEDRARLRASLDRAPPPQLFGMLPAWRARWFSMDGEFLGERSARTRPDDVGAVQRCDCEVCRGTVRP
jgi:hypothetical protein